MEKFIEVYDNIIPIPFSNLVEKLLLKEGAKNKIAYNFFDNFITFHPDHSTKKEKGFGFGFTYLQTPVNIPGPNLLFLNQVLYSCTLPLNFIVNQLLQARIWITIPEKENFISFPHIDRDSPHLVGLYYVNDSDGDTIFFDDDKTTIIKRVSPKKGRMVIFNGLINHASSTPTKNVRCVINYNFTILN